MYTVVFWIGIASLAVLTLFSALNLALRVPSRARISEKFDRAGRGEVFRRFVERRSQLTLATAIVRSAAVLLMLISTIQYVADAWPSVTPKGVGKACLLAWVLVLVFGVAIPNAWAKYSGEWLVVRSLPLLEIVRWFCYPIIFVLELFDPVVRRLAGVPIRDAQSYADELEQEILQAVTEGELHGAVDEEEKEMIESVIELTDTHVEEIMTPRTDIVAIPKGADLDAVLDVIRANGHSRIPVYDENIDKILGVLYAKDMLLRPADEPFDLMVIMRNAFFIPESKLVRELLREFQGQKLHIAVVLDEYGGTAGLVTIEDIVEELVGEIVDEYETVEPAALKRIDDHTVEVDARMRIDDLNDELNINLPEDGDFETVGGYVFSTLGKIPIPGEQCAFENIDIRVLAAEPRRITRLSLTITPIEDTNQLQD